MSYSTDKWFRYLHEGEKPQEKRKASTAPRPPRQTQPYFDQEIEESTNRMNMFLSQVDLLNEISPQEADNVMNWFGDDYDMLSFDDLFKGKLRRAIPLQSEDAKKLLEVVNRLKSEGWKVGVEVPWDGGTHNSGKFPVKTVKQKERRRVGELPAGFGEVDPETNPDPRPVEEYEVDTEVADLRLTKTRTITIPKGPRAGETVEKKDETTMSRAILKNKNMPIELQDWWRKKQVYYTKEGQWKQIERFFKEDVDKDDLGMMAILSRHPLDVLRMSDIDKIRSCHSEGASEFHCAIAESRGHGPIAYLVSPQQYEKLMSGDLGVDPSVIEDMEFRKSLIDTLVKAEGASVRWTFEPPDDIKPFLNDNGVFSGKRYASEYFIPKYEKKLGDQNLTPENVSAALAVIFRASNPSERQEMMPRFGYSYLTSKEQADDWRFRITMVDRLTHSEKFDQYGEKDFDNKWSQAALDGGEIDYEEYAKEHFIPKYSHSLGNISGFGPEWLTVKNVAAAAEAVHRQRDTSASPERAMDRYGYKMPDLQPLGLEAEYADYERKKKEWDQKEEATTWLKQYYEKFPKVAARIASSNRAKKHDDVDQVIDGIQDSDSSAFTSLPTSVRKHLNDEWFIRAATAAVNKDNFSLNGLNLQPPQPPKAPEKKKITDISDFDDQEIFRDKHRGIEGIGARARVRLRKFVDDEEDIEFAVPEQRLYGLSVPGFLEAVRKWTWDEQKNLFTGPNGEVTIPNWNALTRHGGSYEDYRDGTILNNFFAEGGFPDEYRDGVNVSHDYDEAEYENRQEEIFQEAVDEVENIVRAWNGNFEACSLDAEVEEFNDYDDQNMAPSVSAWGSCRIAVRLPNAVSVKEESQADLGDSSVPYFVVRFEEDYFEDGTASTVFPVSYHHKSPGSREIADMLARDEGEEEISWDLTMDHASGEVYFNVEYSIPADYDYGNGPDVAEYLGQWLHDEWDSKIDEIHEQIRKGLVELEYLAPSHFDKKAEDEDHEKWAEELRYFRYQGPDDDGEMWFTLFHDSGTERFQTTDVIVPFGLVATRGQTQMVATDVVAIIGGTVDRDSARTQHVKHTGQAKRALAAELRRLEAEANAYVARQMNFDFGDPKYDKPEDAFGIDLAKTVFFSTYLVENDSLLSPEQRARLKSDKDRYLGFGMRITVKSVDTEKEIEGAFKFVEYIDKNMDRVKLAFETIYKESIEEYEEQRKKVLQARSSRGTMSQYINALDTYIRNVGPPEWDSRNHHRWIQRLASAMAFVEWTDDAFDHMRAYEKRAWIENYLRPLQAGNEMAYEFEPDREAGTPRNFGEAARAQLAEMGASHNQINSYTWEGPKTYPEIYDKIVNPAQKPEIEAPSPDEVAQARSIMAQGDRTDPDAQLEEQIMRVQKLTEKKRDPSHDLRIYRMQLSCGVVDGVGGTDAEIMAEMRGIEAVTTVRPIADSKRRITPTEMFTIFEVKFELLGSQSRVDYRDQVLLPAVRKIAGIQVINWSAIHRTNTQGTVRTVREALEKLHEQGFGASMGSTVGGKTGWAGDIRFPNTPPRPTPTPTLDSIKDDWVDGGVQVYDMPTNTNEMQYHTMMPVSELWHHCSRYSRHPHEVFDVKQRRFDSVYQRLKDKLEDPTAYQDFIQNGANGPVYLAIGKNGRIKITGNEDLVWFAKKAGLEEVPVFISYQRQV